MKRIMLVPDLSVSLIIQGHWRIDRWNLSSQELLSHTQQLIEKGITTVDHADIYGDYTCEALFGKALALDKSLRSEIQIITKCGIKLLSDKYPKRTLKTYDLSHQHILQSVENSLQNLHTDYIDLLLLHRPSPMYNPEEVASVFAELHSSGKVLHFGVSNFNPQQYNTLQSYLDQKLITNQIEISPLCHAHFDNDNIDFCLEQKIHPMAWSPLGGGRLFSPESSIENRVLNCLTEIKSECNMSSIETAVYAWLLMHPAGIIPIVGTSRIERAEKAIEAINTPLSQEQWFRIYNAYTGTELP